MMKDAFAKGLALVLVTTLLSSTGQALLKYGAINDAKYFFFNIFFWLGLVCYGAGMLTLILGIKNAELSSLFPVLALSFVWVMMLSAILFHEQITTLKLGGTMLIVAGVATISMDRKK